MTTRSIPAAVSFHDHVFPRLLRRMCPSFHIRWIGRPVLRSRASATSLPDFLGRSWWHVPCPNICTRTVGLHFGNCVISNFFDSSLAFVVSASRGRSLLTHGGARIWIMLLIWRHCGINFETAHVASNLLVRCCANSLGTRASSAAVLMSSPRAVVVGPLDLLLSYRWTSSSYSSSPAGKSCNLHRSGTKMCRKRALRFPPLRGSQRRTNRLSASRPDGAAPRTISKLSLSDNARSATRTCSLFS